MRTSAVLCCDCQRRVPPPARGPIPRRCPDCRAARSIQLSSASRRRCAGRPPATAPVDQGHLTAAADTAANRAAAAQRAQRRLDWSSIRTALTRSLA